MNIVLVILCIVLLLALIVAVTYIIRLGKIIIDVEDALAEALDICDQSYVKMSTVMELPVALNTPEVKQVLQDIGKVRDAVLFVSNVLAEPYGGVEEEADV